MPALVIQDYRDAGTLARISFRSPSMLSVFLASVFLSGRSPNPTIALAIGHQT